MGGKVDGYYLSKAVSYGFQAGIATFGYVMFLMDDESVNYVHDTAGWEVGLGPNITVGDVEYASKLTTTSVQDGILVFFVNQEGLFAGGGIEGTKITRIEK